MDKLKGLYDRLQKKKTENSFSRSSSNDYDYFNDKLTSLSITELNSSTKKKKKKVSPKVFDNLYKSKTVSALHNSIDAPYEEYVDNSTTSPSPRNKNNRNNNNNDNKISGSRISNKKKIPIKNITNKESIKINKSTMNNTDDSTIDDNNKNNNSKNNSNLNAVKCLECNRPYDTNNGQNTHENSNRMKEIISSVNDWKSSAAFHTVCLTTSIEELIKKVLYSLLI